MSKRKTDRDGLFRRKDSPHWWAQVCHDLVTLDAGKTRLDRLSR